jgi:hypothetical protein
VSRVQIGGVVLVALVVAMLAWRVVPAFRWVDEQASVPAGSRLGRELSPARSVDIDPRPIERAAELMPRNATYAVLIGENYPFTHAISGQTLPAWAEYRLLPRRRVDNAAEADWVISYAADLAQHSVFPTRTIDLGLGVSLARVP